MNLLSTSAQIPSWWRKMEEQNSNANVMENNYTVTNLLSNNKMKMATSFQAGMNLSRKATFQLSQKRKGTGIIKKASQPC
jgi:hypothetical protein